MKRKEKGSKRETMKHKDIKEDKKMIKKMVKSSALKGKKGK